MEDQNMQPAEKAFILYFPKVIRGYVHTVSNQISWCPSWCGAHDFTSLLLASAYLYIIIFFWTLEYNFKRNYIVCILVVKNLKICKILQPKFTPVNILVTYTLLKNTEEIVFMDSFVNVFVFPPVCCARHIFFLYQ